MICSPLLKSIVDFGKQTQCNILDGPQQISGATCARLAAKFVFLSTHWLPRILPLPGSSFLQQTLSTGYPRLLRLFHEFFAKIAVHTDAIYSEAYQR